jgi:hypothetical protein
MKDFDPFQDEVEYVRKNFNLEEYIEFQYYHDIQIIRGEDYQYCCYIDKKCCTTALSPLYAIVVGIKIYKENLKK